MSRLLYIANARMPNEKAHGYQIAQMCEAFALAGEDVTLVVPRRVNEPDLRGIDDIWTYYGIRQNFRLVRLPCLDLIWRLDNQFAFMLQSVSFISVLLIWMLFHRFDRIFSRDHLVMAVLSPVTSRRKLIYEVHGKFRSRRGLRFQVWLLRRVGKVVSLTGSMAHQLSEMGAENVLIAHDGVRPERFENENNPNLSQTDLGLRFPEDAFVACYAGRLHSMGMSKGLDTFIEAAAKTKNIVFLLVGGPDEDVQKLREKWITLGLPPQDFHTVGTVPAADVPRYLAAADVCLIPSPHNEFFAYESSPMKLFEYMFAGRAIIASDLPAIREIVRHGESAYLVPPSDVDALAVALQTLRDDPALREKLGIAAKKEAMQYTWEARARRILA